MSYAIFSLGGGLPSVSPTLLTSKSSAGPACTPVKNIRLDNTNTAVTALANNLSL